MKYNFVVACNNLSLSVLKILPYDDFFKETKYGTM